MKYYSVVCPMGHVGSGKVRDIKFYIMALNAYDAMKKAMRMPAVKHSRIALSVKEIDKQEFAAARTRNAYKV
jgi:hypothetical protein